MLIEHTFSSRTCCGTVTPEAVSGSTPTTSRSACSAANFNNRKCPGWTTLKLPETKAMLLAVPQAMRKAWLSVESSLVRSSGLFPGERAVGATMQPRGLVGENGESTRDADTWITPNGCRIAENAFANCWRITENLAPIGRMEFLRGIAIAKQC